MTLLKILIDYIIVPGLTWISVLLAAFDWIGRTRDLEKSLWGGALLLTLVAAYAYQAGYKGLYLAGRKRYFYIVFIAPIVVGIAGLFVGLSFR
jgi:NO-binding membrane sensor protein with MHYT domain